MSSQELTISWWYSNKSYLTSLGTQCSAPHRSNLPQQPISTAPITQQQQPTSSTIHETIGQNMIWYFGNGPKKPDKTYSAIWKNCQHGVQEKLSLSFPPYLMWDSVDLCFMEIFGNKNIGHGHTHKHVSALQVFADNKLTEHAGKGSWCIEDGLVVSQALDYLKQKNKSSLSKLFCTWIYQQMF